MSQRVEKKSDEVEWNDDSFWGDGVMVRSLTCGGLDAQQVKGEILGSVSN